MEPHKEHGKVLSVRFKPENVWLIAEIEKDSKMEYDGKRSFSGTSEYIESILVKYYEYKFKLPDVAGK